jgi:beta-glucosidase-like glycosyl hydrolase/CubicO group peptidase (beta-lactamase class C family)
MGQSVGEQFRKAGIFINLAPDADVNNNAENPVINYRSFGENPSKVSKKALMYMKGMQDKQVMAVAKHFPGHGDTGTDSHYDMPVITHDRARLDSVELAPFRSLIAAGISGVMPGHLSIPALDPEKNMPTTLSHTIITGLLKNELGFSGLVFSDAMNMQGLTKAKQPGEAEAAALAAGLDVLEYVQDPEKAINTIMDKIGKNEITPESVNEKCRKVLAAKYWTGAFRADSLSPNGFPAALTSGKSLALIRELYASAITLLRNEKQVIPVKQTEGMKIATLAINSNDLSLFQKRIADYVKADHFFIDSIGSKKTAATLKKLSGYDLVIAGVFDTDQRPTRNFGIQEGLNELIGKLNSGGKCIITYFGNPYAIAKLPALEKSSGLLLPYQLNDFTEDLSAQLIFGAIGAKGTLPVTINSGLKSGFGIQTEGGLRVQYGFPESAGLSSEKLLAGTDAIVNEALAAGAFPGCEVLIARKGVVVLTKTYGYQTYDKKVAVGSDDLFDLASVTKISAALPGLMLLNSQGRFSPDATIGSYLPEFNKSDKGKIGLRDLLTHQAGLTPFIQFWKETMNEDGSYKKKIYRTGWSEKYPYEVAPGLFINRNYKKKMFSEIMKSKIGEKKYVYSDLTFIIAPEIIGRITGEKWQEFVSENIWQKIGASDITYNPWQKYPSDRIIPTEYDSLFRKQQLRGTVHDEGAAMLGGISGHAGLFATGNDLMKLMELYRRMGNYAGQQIISSDILKEYTKVQFPGNNNRRGLGFDKPLLDNKTVKPEASYPCIGASPTSFGHSGYTGTFVWVDPDSEISYVFLCNRVYPTRNNNIVSDLNIRTRILQGIYDAIEK